MNCDCDCHAPHHDLWSGWCDDCDSTHSADLTQLARREVGYLWSDMADASRNAINTTWSINMSNIAGRIVALSRHTGALPWVHVSTALLRAGIYQRVYDNTALTYPPIDWDRVAESERRIASTLSPS